AKRIGGTIVKWYEGQEHATAGHERKRFAQMLQDAAHHRFDALMVTDASRLTRDPQANLTLIRTFKEDRIRLFIQGQEHDLHNPKDRFMLGMLANVHAFYIEEQIGKSINNRIEAAKRGYPVCGTLPFGRYADIPTDKEERKNACEWSIDEDCKRFL